MCEVVCMTDNAVFIQWVNTKVQHAIPWDHFKRDFAPVLLETPFGDEPACVQRYQDQKVVVLGTWGEWSWVTGEQSWKPFVVATSELDKIKWAK